MQVAYRHVHAEVLVMTIKKHSRTPITRVMRHFDDDDFVEKVIRLAWADRITFEEIETSTGLSEDQVIKLMKRHQAPKTFRRWRERVNGRSTKHRKRFEAAHHRWVLTVDDDGGCA